MNIFSGLDSACRRNLWVLFASGLLFWASLAALLPTLSLYIKHIGATNYQIGLVMGSFAIGLVLFRHWVGQLADQRGRKVVLMIGLLAVAIAPIGYLLTRSLALLTAVRAFHGLSIAAFTTGYSALVVDLSPDHKRGELIGVMSLVNPVGMAIGPALGGLLLGWAGYTPLFLLSAGSGVAGLVCASQVVAPPVKQSLENMPENMPDSQIQPPPSRDEPFWQLVSSPRLRVPLVVMLLIGLAFGTLSTFVPLLIQEARVDFNAGFFYTAAAISSFLVRLPTGRASDRHGRGLFITCSLGCYTIAMLMIWSAQTPSMFLLAGLIEGAGTGILIPMMIALIADRAEPQERGRVFGLVMTGFDLGIAIAGPILGYFADEVGYRGLFGLASGLSFLALLIFLSLSSQDFTDSFKFALGKGQDLYALRLKGTQGTGVSS
ncbi:MFS transporter [Leptothermofonsia sichuanensis E412]|uniref:MFS transporter n=1 Tax=Leptothermofonsia sichuanensis TaxID=2917832 RepID=UPI001CA720DA|nr:MFS transporter [Leptothermofonsia sichuanensis]QZZ22671.1 MFS transporter [Leptothermofonsia sichuanensis E412]